MEKSIEKIWNESFIKEDSLVIPKVNDLYNQKSKSIIDKIKRTYEIDNKSLLPLALVFAIVMSVFSNAIIGIYASFLMVLLYFYNRNLLNNFNNIDIKSDNLTYLKNYKNVINSITKSSKKLVVFIIPIAILSIFVITFYVKEKSFLNKFISNETKFIEILGIGSLIVLITSIIAFTVFSISTKVLYATHLNKLDMIISEIETLKK
ncbi:hypothetical protein OD91_2446 [Lutibacter sp. Hel_I_33_5]|uniref:hypothetical protein n=1 Tax=Lutibacter sp. Hel_I_33_5 TaxID=1566289 RepID=UPI0011A57B89|nr:hypothetical protein [Lutibacter sp. Hel_I_33_5]TVZ57139.1 hypothetical protein OD91_2446 [Lutibacter sp. Hel_I_33_5]